jgi:hypothetical protein
MGNGIKVEISTKSLLVKNELSVSKFFLIT